MTYFWRSKVTLYSLPVSDEKRMIKSCSDLDSKLVKEKEVKSEPIIRNWRNDSFQLMNESLDLIMRKYLMSEEYKNFQGYFVTGTSQKAISLKLVYQMFEKILAHYKIDIYSVWNDMADSAVSITSVKLNVDMYCYAGILLKELKEFPYTLYRALNCRIFTFCGETKMMSPAHKDIFLKKYYNWFFMIDEQKTPEQIRKHLYNTICYNVVNYFKGLNEKWESLNPKSPKGRPRIVLKIGEIKAGYLNPKCYKGCMVDQFEVFEALMVDPQKILAHDDPIVAKKARILLRALVLLDSEGLDEKWWKKKGLVPVSDKQDYIFQGK